MLEVRHLTKRFSRIAAVNEVSFTIRPGEILGYLGPNGSGKSTTVKMLNGLLPLSEGEILFCGQNIKEDPISFRRRVGYVPEEPFLYAHLSGKEYLQLVGRLRGMPRPDIDRKAESLLYIFGLSEVRHSLISSYSKGMRQKVLLSAALLHNPDLLIFDEPFSGLDVTAAQVLKNLLKILAAEGKMIFYSSHVLEVVEKVCSSVLILRKGVVVAYDSVSNLRQLMLSPSLEDVFSQLALGEDTETAAQNILRVMKA
ncbi:MAG TPA: ABC transporter ATP-binding protein [Bryobacteraceae bacterium]|jgi:ABC-2 type transport system ATP-binding protein|nr:ABC transporter ATP-binding protein [Bryobacteraceae bacterium]